MEVRSVFNEVTRLPKEQRTVPHAIVPTSIFPLFQNAESEMCHACALDNGCVNEFDPLAIQVVEETNARAKQNWRELDRDLIHKPGKQTLLHDLRATNRNILAVCSSFCLSHGTFDTIGHKRKW